jgi:thioredoxin-related protein
MQNKLLWVSISLFIVIGATLIKNGESSPPTKDTDNFWKSVPSWDVNTGNIEKIDKIENNKKELVIGNPKTYAEALLLANKNNSKVILFFHADYCGYCTKMEQQTLADATVKDKLNSYVFYSVDTQKEAAVTSKYGITGIPATKMIDGKENVLKSATGFQTVEKFLKFLSN